MAANFTKSKASVTTNIADNNVQAITATKLRQTLNEIITDAENSINNVDVDLSPVNQRIDGIIADQNKIVQDWPERYYVSAFRGIGSAVNGIVEDLEICEYNIEDTATQVNQNTRDISSIRNTSNTHTNRLNYVDEQIGDIQTDIRDIKSNLTASKIILEVRQQSGKYSIVKDDNYYKVDWYDVASLMSVSFKYWCNDGVNKQGTFYWSPNMVQDFVSNDGKYFAYAYYTSYDKNAWMWINVDKASISFSGGQPWEQYRVGQ